MSSRPDLPRLLESVTLAVLEAGGMLRREALRSGGPRGSGAHADVDEEIERHLGASLTELLPARFVGEETGISGTGANGFCWLVDPHDGTRDFLGGHRGGAVSVGLLRDGEPIPGVVYAPMPPDRGADLIAWAEGMDHLLRNGRLIHLNGNEYEGTDQVL
jgi:fructose-1,6-bisphosphatase/inositol monophosphatase family enzyme